MAYASNSDITNEFRSINFSASNAALSTTEIDAIIAQEEALLDARIAGIYTTPITGTYATQIMKRLSILMTKARVEEILTVKVGMPKPEQGSIADGYREQVDKIIEQITTRKILLTDATLGSSDAGFKSYANDNTDTVEPKFQKGEDQW